MTYSPNKLETVASASAALLASEQLTTLRTAPAQEVYLLLQRSIAQSIFAYLEMLNNWGLDPES